MNKTISVRLAGILLFSLAACGNTDTNTNTNTNASAPGNMELTAPGQEGTDMGGNEEKEQAGAQQIAETPEDFVLIRGGSFDMGSPETEAWRSEDETQHPVMVSDFYIGMYEVTQVEYRNTMGNNPSYFSGDNLPVESISWLDAVAYCNARSKAEGLNPVYAIRSVSGWNVA